MRLIDADALNAEMYHKSFEVDDGRNVWNSGLWIRYKIFEEAIRDAPTIDAVPMAAKCFKEEDRTMKKTYLLIIDETGKHVRKLVICEKCVYFRRQVTRVWRHEHICIHPDGMINPMPEYFCPLGKDGIGDE